MNLKLFVGSIALISAHAFPVFATNSDEWRQNCSLTAEPGSLLEEYRAVARELDNDSDKLSTGELKKRSELILKNYGGFSEVLFSSVVPSKARSEAEMAKFVAMQLENILPVVKASALKEWSNGFMNMKGLNVSGFAGYRKFEWAKDANVRLVFNADAFQVSYRTLRDNKGLVGAEITAGNYRSLLNTGILKLIMLQALNAEHAVVTLDNIQFYPICKN